MENEAKIIAAAEHWEALAREALRMAEWNEAHVGSGAPQRHKAATYRRAADALRKEAATGVSHCVCCLKPRGKPTGPGAVLGH
jgi:hypothetical protein